MPVSSCLWHEMPPTSASQDPHSLPDLARDQHIVGPLPRHANVRIAHVLCPPALKVAACGPAGLCEALTSKQVHKGPLLRGMGARALSAISLESSGLAGIAFSNQEPAPA